MSSIEESITTVWNIFGKIMGETYDQVAAACGDFAAQLNDLLFGPPKKNITQFAPLKIVPVCPPVYSLEDAMKAILAECEDYRPMIYCNEELIQRRDQIAFIALYGFGSLSARNEMVLTGWTDDTIDIRSPYIAVFVPEGTEYEFE